MHANVGPALAPELFFAGFTAIPIAFRRCASSCPAAAARWASCWPTTFGARPSRDRADPRPIHSAWQTVHWDGESSAHGPSTWKAPTSASTWPDAASTAVPPQPTARLSMSRASDRLVCSARQSPDLPIRPVWMNASATALYKRVADAHGVDLPLDETSEAADGERMGAEARSNEAWSTHAALWRVWSATGRPRSFAAETPRTRKIALRSGVVLSPTPGSAFGVLSNLVRLSLGGHAGQRTPVCPLDS